MEQTKTILIIEDEEALRRALEKKLQADGYTVITAENGQQGLDAVRDKKPDLVLLDILMPEVDGFQVLEKLSADGLLPALPVVIVSNSGQPVEIDRAMKLGARDYMVKAQFDPQEVLDKVHQVLGDKVTSATTTPVETSSAPVAVSGETVFSGHRVLVVEDDQFLRELLERKLKSEGFAVETAIEGESALAKVKSFTPEIVLLDVILPGVDGFSILEQLKADPTLVGIPVVMLTNLGQKDDVEKGMKLGAVGYLVKAHFTPGDIVEKVKETLKIT